MAGVPYRIDIRQVGESLHAYWLPVDRSQPEELVASCSLEILNDAPELQSAWFCFMRMASIAMCKSRLGVVPRDVDFTPDPSLRGGPKAH